MAIRYLLGIDGGGTKTEFLLTDRSKNEISRVILGASNPVNTGLENAMSILRKGISECCKGIPYNEISVFAGLAGGETGNNQAEIAKFLSEFGFGAAANGSDARSAVALALGASDGVAVITGTGIIGYAVKGEERHRIGGWGYMIDKGGSGFSFGSDALDCALRCADGRGGSKKILSLVEKMLTKPLTESIGDIYSKGAAYVASFAPVVFEAYEDGDECAEQILNKNALEIAKIINTGCRLIPDNCNAVICGGISRQKKVLEPFIRRHLDGNYNIRFISEPMVNGAVALAEKEAENA